MAGPGTAKAAEEDPGHAHEPDHEQESVEAIRGDHVDIMILYNPAEGLHFGMGLEAEHGHEQEEHGHEDDEHDHDHGHDHEYGEPGDFVLVAGAAAEQAIPEAGGYGFVGEAGETMYVLPQSEQGGLPFVGLNTEELVAGDWPGGIELELVEVEGPGGFSVYELDSFGRPEVRLGSGAKEGDGLGLGVGLHQHVNWAFTVPGQYQVSLVARGEHAELGELSSEPQVFAFTVGAMGGFFSPYEVVAGDWIEDAAGKLFQVENWPWIWSAEEGWLYAVSEGLPAQSFYRVGTGTGNWIQTHAGMGYWKYEYSGEGGWKSWGE